MATGIMRMLEEQEKEAEALLKANIDEANDPRNTGGQPPAPINPAPETPPEGQTPPAEPAQAPSDQPTLEQIQAEAANLQSENANLKQQLAVVKGKLNAEIPRMAAEIRELKSSRMPAQGDASPEGEGRNTEGQPAQAHEALDTAEQQMETDFGAGFVKGVAGIARKEVAADIEEVKKVAEQIVLERYFGRLDQIVPNWRENMNDPKFAEFLQGIEGNTRIQRIQFARDFDAKRDADGVAGYHLQFNELKRAAKPAQPAAQPSGQQNQNERQLAPGTSPNGATAGGGEKEEWFRGSDLTRLAQDEIRGVYRGREKELDEIHRRIDKAQAAGRILPD